MGNYRVIMQQSIPSIAQIYENVCYFHGSGGTDTQADLAAELNANFCVSIRNFQTWFLGWQFLFVYKLGPAAPPVLQYAMNNQAGLAQVGYLYPSTALKIRWTGSTGGRHGHGRFYVAGSRNDWATAGGITASAATNGAVHINNIINRYGVNHTSNYQLVLWDRKSTEQAYVPVQSGALFQYLGQQRSRNY